MRRGLGWIALSLSLSLAISWLLARAVPLPGRLGARDSVVVLYADGSVAHAFLSSDERWRIGAQLPGIDPRYLEALVALEDQRFWWHPGIDPVAIIRAGMQNLGAGETVSGASTLTMQLVRVLEPRPRTLGSKVIEALRAAQLELVLSKEEVLAAYLSYVPYGRNLEGIEAASLSMFGHRADVLAPQEMAVLLAVPQDPNERYPHPDHTVALRAARDRIAQRLLAAGQLQPLGEAAGPGAVLQSIQASTVPPALIPMPRTIPHAAQWLRRRDASLEIATTLDRGAQGVATRALARMAAEGQRQGIHNGAVVVVDHHTAEIVALVGNLDFWDGEHGGQIPAFAEPRSPGSTLKPFLYGMGIDRGEVLPEHLVQDVPVRWGAYAPDNYDGTFSGMVSLESALSQSLNVPFVDLLGQLGTEAFVGLLRDAGTDSLVDAPGHYGLSLVAGGIELSALELAGLYVALAHDGLARPLRWRAGATPGVGTPILSPGAAWLTRRTLRLRDRPDFPSRGRFSSLSRDIHWKTGTSYGHLDAWAVGSDHRWTAVVWLGNLDRSSSRALVGAPAAGPILFDVLEALPDEDAEDLRPEALVSIEICSLSGRVPGPDCPHRSTAWALGHRVPSEPCALHERIEVDVQTGRRVRPGCRGDRETEERVVVVWPAAVRRWLDDAPPLPPLDPACAPVASSRPPRIVSPADGTVARLIAGLEPDEQEMRLEADAHGEVSWFVDGTWLGRVPPGEAVWWIPSRGEHHLIAQDTSGRRDAVRIEVR